MFLAIALITSLQFVVTGSTGLIESLNIFMEIIRQLRTILQYRQYPIV